jgi:UDPglucose--hexose-1-phosphate uridylyltransferase
MSENNSKWEMRWNPFLSEWVIIASQTSVRPWSGNVIKNQEDVSPDYDESCYLCPGVTRASGEKNSDYEETFVFDNDFASFAPHAPEVLRDDEFFRAVPAKGQCRVVCFSPKHNVVLAQMNDQEIMGVIKTWLKEFEELSKKEFIKNILIFENKGKVIGVSNPHPHGQIYATGFIPRTILQEVFASAKYFKEKKECLFCNYLKSEIKEKCRIVFENDSFVLFVPYFARYSYETQLMPKRHFHMITEMTDKEKVDFADILRKTLCKYDNLFGMVMPNIMMMHNAPVDGDDYSSVYHFHVEFYPPLRSPDKLKYMAGFESGGGNIINPTDPDFAAEELRKASDVHFRNM